jgi:hypothetical protein
MLEELNPKQEKLMDDISIEYEKNVLDGDDSYDVNKISEGINFIYKLADLPEPQIVICQSPMDMAIEADLKSGETIDYLGSGYDSGWTAFYDFFQRIGIDFDKEWGFDIWKEFILNSGVFATVLCENVAFVCIRPFKVNLNENGDLHSDKEMAIEWQDGYGEYYMNGVSMPENIIMTAAHEIDPKLVLTEKNAEVRREIVRKIGVVSLCEKLNSKCIDSENGYELLLLDLGDGRNRPYLKMKNPSIGTFHIEGVSPDIKTVKQALAWRNQSEESPILLT